MSTTTINQGFSVDALNRAIEVAVTNTVKEILPDEIFTDNLIENTATAYVEEITDSVKETFEDDEDVTLDDLITAIDLAVQNADDVDFSTYVSDDVIKDVEKSVYDNVVTTVKKFFNAE